MIGTFMGKAPETGGNAIGYALEAIACGTEATGYEMEAIAWERHSVV